jgi:hypothetical protein
MTRLGDEATEALVGDGILIDPESRDSHVVREALLRIVGRGARAEGASWNPHHIRKWN